MAETDEAINLNDVIKEQSQTIKTLVGNIQETQQKPQGAVKSPVYFTTPQTTKKTAPNYILWVAIGLGVYLVIGRK